MHNKLLTLFLYHKIFPNISFSISSRKNNNNNNNDRLTAFDPGQPG